MGTDMVRDTGPRARLTFPNPVNITVEIPSGVSNEDFGAHWSMHVEYPLSCLPGVFEGSVVGGVNG